MKQYLTISTAVIIVIFFSPIIVSAQNLERIFYLTNKSASIESFRKHSNEIDVIAPQSYKISASLVLSGSVGNDVKTIAKNAQVKIMPLIVNQGFEQRVVHNLLGSSTAQDKIIDRMIEEAIQNNYNGWQLDLEHISYQDRDAYTQFVQKAAHALHAKGLEISVAAVARTNDVADDHYQNWSGAFDYAALANAVDFISIMTYDDPDSIGPAASLPFVQNVYAYLDGKVPREKLSLGIPLYAWMWDMSSSKKIGTGTFASAQLRMKSHAHYGGFDATFKVPYFVYTTKNKTYGVWYENDQSFKEKLDFVTTHTLRGFSAWVLGSEDPHIWSVLTPDSQT